MVIRGMSMCRLIDMTEQRFGTLTVIKRAEDYISPKGYRYVQWLCTCDCGNELIVRGDLLRSGHTKSCGCNKNKMPNVWDLESHDYGIGYTNKGEKFYFDKEDFDKIKEYTWWINEEGYVVAKDKMRKKLSLHRLITNCPKGLMPDHIHGRETRFDNRKSNLRVVNDSKNQMNTSLSSNNTSGVTGVTWHKGKNKWTAQITINRKQISLGSFNNFDDAVKARKKAEEKYFGEFSYDNSMAM